MWRYRKKENIIYIGIQKRLERKPAKCGVWIDGKQVITFDEMLDKSVYEKKECP